jgi:hypothetical protein
MLFEKMKVGHMGNLSKQKSRAKDRRQMSVDKRVKKWKGILSRTNLSNAFRHQCERNLKAISK